MPDPIPQFNDILLYTSSTGKVKIEVFFEGETFWLSQRKMAELFGVDVRTVNEHLQSIYKTNELLREATIRKFRIVQTEGTREVNREVEFYNLDAIIAVGYRVNSYQATQFRIWATQTLREFIIKGFVLNDEMLKNGKPFGKDYFDEEGVDDTSTLPHIPPKQIYFTSKKSSKPYLDPSRPIPLSFTPPNGATVVATMPVLTPTMPYSSASATRNTRPISRP